MWRFRLIRFRLTLTYTLLLAGAFALFSAGVVIGLNQVLYDNFRHRIEQAADKVVKQYKIQPSYVSMPYFGVHLRVTSETVGGDANDTTKNYVFLDSNGLPIAGDNKHGDPKVATDPKVKQSITHALTLGSSQNLTVKGKNGDTNVLVYPTGAGDAVLLFQASLQDTEDTVALLQRIMIMAAAVVTVLSAAGAWFLTGRVLRPLDKMGERVRRITARDLNERLHINQRDEIGRLASTFDDMISRLQASFERQKRFASDASHELRTPLTVMQADISLALRRPRTAPEYQRTLESAQEEVARLSRIVSDLLTLTRLDTDVALIAHEPLALDELVDGVVVGLRPLAKDKSISLTYSFDAPVHILGDVTRLKQLFINLLDNAIAYTPEGGSVYVTLTSDPDSVTITVSDTGIGIESRHLPHIFERFYRADEARSRGHEGTGLGLAIARTAVQAHNGTIDVSSAPGEGTTFTVVLPLGYPIAAEQPGTPRLGRLALPAAG
ncbi:MAG: cztS [Chloroflexi bacterium]|jgi:heavy metal sensor kinase|nr:cztS [Chloroflexota bacterium]